MKFAKTDEDPLLVRSCLDGEPRAFDELVTRYDRRIFNAVLRMVRHREDAADVTQSVFLKVYENLSRYDPEYKFFSWIYRIAMNEALDHISRNRRLKPLNQPADVETMSDLESPQEVSGEVRDVQNAIGKLKPDHRAVVVLKHLVGCSYQEIGVILELPEKTVKSRLFSARESLREALTGCTAPETTPRRSSGPGT